MKRNVRFITETAVMLALLICLQWLGSFVPNPTLKQLVTGSFVNCVLAVTVLVAGLYSGITVAVISPVCAFLFGIAPNFITVLPIMLGNSCYITILWLLRQKGSKPFWKPPVALALAAAVKFGVLYFLVVRLICGLAADKLLGQKIGQTVLLAPPMLNMLPAMFTWPQLSTALIGGGVAFLIVPLLRKALKNH